VLPANIKVAIGVNAYHESDPINFLSSKAELFLTSRFNHGYGTMANRLFSRLRVTPECIAIVNTDIEFDVNQLVNTIEWFSLNQEVVLLVPDLVNEKGERQKLCKYNPTLLSLISRRFISSYIKPLSLLKYDEWFCMNEYDYNQIFDVEYLSGCFMLIKSWAYSSIGGFDESFFLYLEDADITRRLAAKGRCIHYPNFTVTHKWGRGSHKSLWLTAVNIISSIKYFRKWGIKWY
jgi:GT2 family glycosyltransferase